MKMVKCLTEFEYFTVFLKNRNFIFKIRLSKVTDYASFKRSGQNASEYLSNNMKRSN